MKLNARGKILASAAGMLIALSAPAVGFGADTIKFGVAGAHSGDLASYGLPTVNAAKLVIDQVNANGGVNGMQVELLVEDDVCKPEVAPILQQNWFLMEWTWFSDIFVLVQRKQPYQFTKMLAS